MARILSVSYDSTLLLTRQLLLEQMGHTVISAEGFAQAFAASKEGNFDLLIMGHSIPHHDKAAILKEVKQNCNCPTLALLRHGEPLVQGIDRSIDAWEPRAFLSAVHEMF